MTRDKAEPDPASPVEITHPDRVIFPEAGITKGELAAYYTAVAPLMLPWAARRPLSLVRCPQGQGHPCFFQKHDAASFGPHVRPVDIREKDGAIDSYLFVEDADGLRACVQMGTIEFHGWGAPTADIEKPDRLVFDLDPDEGLDFAAVKAAARDLRHRLADLGLVSFALLTGGKGIHVVVPLTPGAGWPAVKAFAEGFSRTQAEAEPKRFTATMRKAKRKGRIFIDWLRNQRGNTAIMPYSARARPGGPVAAPVAWEELGEIDRAGHWTVRDAAALIDRAKAPSLAGWGSHPQILPRL